MILSVTGIHVLFLIIIAKIIETADATEPTDKSIPPDIKTIDSPIARTLNPKNHVSKTCQFEISQNFGLIKPVTSDMTSIAITILNIGTLPLTISSNLILKIKSPTCVVQPQDPLINLSYYYNNM
jgi:hypothetical protein